MPPLHPLWTRGRPHAVRALAILLLSTATPAAAVSAMTVDELSARVASVWQTKRYWNDRSVRLTMTMFEQAGTQTVRAVDLYQKHYPGNATRSVVFFRAPATLKDVALFEDDRDGRAPVQWLYQPTSRRTRRVADGAGESLFGSDLTTSDFELMERLPARPRGDRVEMQSDGVVDGVATYVLQYVAAEGPNAKSMRIWLGKDDLVMRRTQVYDVDGALVKTIEVSDVRMIGAIPVPFRIEVRTAAAQSRTVVEIDEIAFDRRLEDELFTEGALMRGRPWSD